MKANTKKYNKLKLPEGWEIDAVQSFEEIQGIRDIWEKMQQEENKPSIDADIDRYISVTNTIKSNSQPYVIILKYQGKPAAMVIAKIEKRSIDIKLGYKTIIKPKLKCLTVSYGGIIGKPNDEACSVIMNILMGFLRDKTVSVIYFNHMEKDSLIYKLSRQIPGFLSRSYFLENEKHWVMSVPESIEQFFQSFSQKHRGRLRRYQRKLEQKYTGKIKIVVYSKEKDLDQAIKDAEKISKNTYQWGLGYGFKDDLKNRELLTTAAKMGWLRLHILYIDGEPCAFENWIKYRKKYIGHGIGFDPGWKQWRIGTVLFLNTIEQLCKDDSVETIDFGFGDAEYKQSYGSTSWDETSVYIFAPRFYPVFINMLQTFFSAINKGLKYTADKFGFINRIKRLWRNRMAQMNPKEKIA